MDLRAGDGALLAHAEKWHERESLNEHYGFPGSVGVIRAKERLNDLITNPTPREAVLGFWDDDIPLGYVVFYNVDQDNRKAEVALVVNPDLQGKGFGRGIMSAALKQAFDHGFYRIECRPIKGRKRLPMKNLLQRLGFKYECTMKASSWIAKETPVDQWLYRITRNEWEKLQRQV